LFLGVGKSFFILYISKIAIKIILKKC
jgi:hypothetical protein